MVEMKINIDDFVVFQKKPDSKIWDIGNGVLYDLCKKYPAHKSIDEVVAKLWLVGRAYAAAIERRQGKQDSSDRFYVKVAQKLISSEIDKQIEKLPDTKQLSEENIKMISDVHAFLTKIFYDLTGSYKVSLASKYLHFHRPIVPIYDSRANKSIRAIFRKDAGHRNLARRLFSHTSLPVRFEAVEKDYLNFVIKVYRLQQHILKETGRSYSLRDIDKYLLERLERER